MAIQKITADVISSDAITTASISDSAITAAKLAGTLDLTGKTITVATASSGDNDTSVASTAFVQQELASLIDSAPGTLNTLNELAAALGDDANFSTTVTNSIATKLPLAGGILTGALTTNGVINTGTSHNFAINTPNSLRINIDSNDSATDQVFVIGHNQTAVDNSNNALMTVLESGNVGIGTTNPSTKLDVNGAIRLTDSTYSIYSSGASAVIGHIGNTANDINIYSSTAGHNGLRFHVNGILPTDNTGTIIDADADLGVSNYRFKDIHLSGTGYFGTSVGIGNTSPSSFSGDGDNLVIGTTSGDNGLSIISGTSNSGSIYFGDTQETGSLSRRGQLVYNHSDDSMRVFTSAAERMRIDSSGNIQIRQNTNAATNSVNLPGYIEFKGQGWDSNSGSDDMNAKIEMDATYGKVGSGATSPELVFSLQGAGGLDSSSEAYVEAMRIVGAGAYNSNRPRVGIGTDSPGTILQVGDGTTTEYITIDKSTTGESGILFKNAGNNKGKILLDSGENLQFYVNNTTNAMTILESGNVGIGDTSPDKKLHITDTGGNHLRIAYNDSYYWDIGRQSADGRLSISDNVNGEAVAILPNGNVGIGVTNPSDYNNASDNLVVGSSGDTGITIASGQASNSMLAFADGTGGTAGYRGRVDYNHADDSMKFNTAATERMRINSSGLVSIGTTAAHDANALLTLSKSAVASTVLKSTTNTVTFANVANGSASVAYSGTASNHPYYFITNGTERMRIESNGDVLIGATSAIRGSEKVGIQGGSTDCLVLRTSAAGAVIRKTSFTNGFLFLFETDSASAVGSITSNGSITAFNTSSDYRLKENVVNLDNALDRVAQLQPKRFNFIVDETNTLVDGFLAHEVSDIVPEAIHGEKDAVDDEGNPVYQGIDQSKLVPLLTKAIQEQQTIIDDLKSRIETLEG